MAFDLTILSGLISVRPVLGIAASLMMVDRYTCTLSYLHIQYMM